MIHSTNEEFRPFPRIPVVGKALGTDPVLFRSESLEIGQNVAHKIVGNKRRHPDIYIKDRNAGKMIGIVQAKIVWNRGLDQTRNELQTFTDFKRTFPGINGLLVLFLKTGYTDAKKKLIEEYEKRNQWFKFQLFEGENTGIRDLFRKTLNL